MGIMIRTKEVRARAGVVNTNEKTREARLGCFEIKAEENICSNENMKQVKNERRAKTEVERSYTRNRD